jgi:hypothetical protein
MVVPVSRIFLMMATTSSTSVRLSLVEQQQLWPHRQRFRQLEALAIGNAELIAGLIGARPEAGEFEQCPRLLACRFEIMLAASEAKQRADRDVLKHGEPWKRFGHLKGAADAAMRARVRRQAIDLFAVEKQAAVVGEDRAADEADEGRFAGAVRADQPEHLAAPQLETDVVDGLEPVKALGEALRLEQGRIAHKRCARMFCRK